MPNESNARLDRIEANLDRITELTLQTAERQSAIEHIVEQIALKLDRLTASAVADGENIRALVRIAEAHERRIDGLENGPA